MSSFYKLSNYDKDIWYQKASYLIDKHYINTENVQKLAEYLFDINSSRWDAETSHLPKHKQTIKENAHV